MLGENHDVNYAIPRLGKVTRAGLAKCHAARAENGLDLPHLFKENPPPNVMFNAARLGVTFVDYVLAAYERAKLKNLVYRARRDQVLAIEGLLTASPGYFRPKSPGAAGKYQLDRVKSIREKVLPFLKSLFGNRLVRVEEQLDEATPHWQFAALPIDNRGRWAAKNVMTRKFLRDVWDLWHRAVADLGLERGHPRMIASHIEVREYYAATVKFGEMAENANHNIRVQPLIVETPSFRAMLSPKELAADLNRKSEEWAKRETKRLNEKLKPFFAAMAGQKIATRKAKEDRKSAIKHSKLLAAAKAEASELGARLDSLMPLDPRNVASQLGLPGVSRNLEKHDAIALVMKLEGLNIDEALGWLSEKFGADQTAATIAARAKNDFLSRLQALPKPRILTGMEIEAIVDKQLDALRAESYEVFLAPHAEKTAKARRYAAEMKVTKSWSHKELTKEIPNLKQANGANRILVRPVSEEYAYYSAVGKSAVDTLRSEGVDICLGLRIDTDVDHVVIRLPRDIHHDRRASKLAEICDRIGANHQLINKNETILLAGFRRTHGDTIGAKNTQRIHLVEVSYANDTTYLAGHEWAKAPRPGLTLE